MKTLMINLNVFMIKNELGYNKNNFKELVQRILKMNDEYIISYDVGLDESHRGSWMGPVYVGAVMIPFDFKESIPEKLKITDSKNMSKIQREKAYWWIIENVLEYHFEMGNEEEIDIKNITGATIACWHRCLDKFKNEIKIIKVDGTQFKKYKDLPHECIPKGDSLELSISCASIIAKVLGDRHIRCLVDLYPYLDERYGLKSNLGYGTSPIHKQGLQKYGPTIFHRMGYKPCQIKPILKKRKYILEETK